MAAVSGPACTGLPLHSAGALHWLDSSCACGWQHHKLGAAEHCQACCLHLPVELRQTVLPGGCHRLWSGATSGEISCSPAAMTAAVSVYSRWRLHHPLWTLPLGCRCACPRMGQRVHSGLPWQALPPGRAMPTLPVTTWWAGPMPLSGKQSA